MFKTINVIINMQHVNKSWDGTKKIGNVVECLKNIFWNIPEVNSLSSSRF